MSLKLPLSRPLRRFLWRLNWFLRNYRSIKRGMQFRSQHYLGPITYDTDSLTTSNNADFIREPRFARAYAAAVDTKPWEGFTLQWRVYIVCWFADHIKRLPGQFVECGVNTGAYARAVIEYVDFDSLNKTFYLFDTFEGMDESKVTEEERNCGISAYLGDHYKDVYEQVIESFSAFNTKIVKGTVPETLPQFTDKEVCFLSIDMNCVAPEIAAAEYFWDRLVPGAVMILDDYGFAPHIHQKLAFDEFARSRNVNILSLPTGQGIIFKP